MVPLQLKAVARTAGSPGVLATLLITAVQLKPCLDDFAVTLACQKATHPAWTCGVPMESNVVSVHSTMPPKNLLETESVLPGRYTPDRTDILTLKFRSKYRLVPLQPKHTAH